MRVTGEIHYQLEHGEGPAGIISCWSVPYSAWLQHGAVHEVEADGMPTLISLTLRVGTWQRPLDGPGSEERRQWQDVWRRESRHCEAELLERFATDCLERHWTLVLGP